jgi:hypothetical protein
MELENINNLIGNANNSYVTPLNFSFKGINFLPPFELYRLENLKGFDTSLNQLAPLPLEISYLKNFTIFNNSNYLVRW